ncbi:MAG: aquaporin [Thermoanaerobaculia bacterium]
MHVRVLPHLIRAARRSYCTATWLRRVCASSAASIIAAYWFTASTRFANPAVTLARAFTNTFSGIELANVIGFIVAQLLGAIVATLLFRWFNLDRSEA